MEHRRRSVVRNFSALLLGALGGLSSAAVDAAIAVHLEVTPRTVLINEQFELNVIVQGASGDVGEVKFIEDGFTLVGRRGVQTSVNIINGRRSQSVTITHRARPERVGILKIPPVTVQIGGRKYTSPTGATVNVRPIEGIEEFFLELASSRDKVYPGQEFTVTLKVLVKKLQGRYSDTVPLPQGGNWPRLEVPWIVGHEGFDSEDPEVYLNTLSPSLNGEGFPINDYSQRRFFENRPYRFGLKRTETQRRAADGEEKGYFVFTLEKNFRAVSPGSYPFAPVTAKGLVFTDASLRRGQPTAKKFVALSNRIEVLVSEVPLEGRPPTYTGAVGQFTISATVSPKKVWAGAPMTFKLRVSGSGKLENIAPVPLQVQKELAALFRLYQDPETGEILADSHEKVFTYTIRPNSAEVESVPPIAFSYFDPDSETFVTVTTEAIPVEVEEGKEAVVEDFQRVDRVRRHQAVERALYPNFVKPDALVRQVPGQRITWVQMVLLAGPPAAYFALLLATLRRRRLTADPSILRSRGASRKAKATLGEAEVAAREGNAVGAYQAVSRALLTFIADRLDRPAAGMTAADAARALQEKGLRREIQTEIRQFLESCEFAQFGVKTASGGELQESVRQAQAYLRTLEKCLR